MAIETLLVIAYLVVLALDVWTTRRAIALGDKTVNPLYGNNPSWGKLVVTHIISWSSSWTLVKHGLLGQLGVGLCILVFVGVVIHNVLARRKALRKQVK